MAPPPEEIGALGAPGEQAFKIGPFGSSLKKSELVQSGIPVAGIENVLPNEFVKGFRRFVTKEKFEELSDYSVRPGDVLVTTMGTVGRAAVAPSGLGLVIIDSHLFRMRLNTARVLPAYLSFAINSDLVTWQLEKMAHGAIMEGLNTAILKQCVVPLPDLHEQERIVEVLERASNLRTMRRYALDLSEHLFRSLLQRVFTPPKKLDQPSG